MKLPKSLLKARVWSNPDLVMQKTFAKGFQIGLVNHETCGGKGKSEEDEDGPRVQMPKQHTFGTYMAAMMAGLGVAAAIYRLLE
ncbi:hypothetical protein UVI_02048870 [Ustilaginoidea virens]|uniref:Uncharacterized protein n=1 Tax=Ustilaginoidea virens TaxID=1159556 RepID=A0A1B5KVL4_USTVR|nr:hypothetical protein UVI_02048870 [Ustilaginoidea virens]